MDSLDDASAGDVETRDDAFGQHYRKFLTMRSPMGPDFSGMELDSGDVAGFERGGIAQAVSAHGGGLRDFGDVVAVSEVHVRTRGDAAEELRIGARFELVPAHVGDARGLRKALHGAGEKAQAADFGGFFAGFEEGLHAKADFEVQDARADAFEECGADVEFVNARII